MKHVRIDWRRVRVLENMSCFSWRQTFFCKKIVTKRNHSSTFTKGFLKTLKKGSKENENKKKKAKKEKRRKTRFAKGTKERKQSDNKYPHQKRRKQRWKKKRRKNIKQKMVHTENNEKKGQIFRVDFGWPGRTERGALPVTSHMFFLAICLLRFPTCTAALPIYLNSLNSRSLVELLILNPLSWVLVL